MLVIIGIDPGSLRTGWGVLAVDNGEMKVLGHGVIRLSGAGAFEERLANLARDLGELLDRFRPQVMAVEKVFLGKNPDSAFKLGHARGVALAIAGVQDVTVKEYATRHAKKMLTGSGAATKEQVQFMVLHALGVETRELDATDALALAFCCARELEVSNSMREQQVARGHQFKESKK